MYTIHSLPTLGVRCMNIHAWVSASIFDDRASQDLNGGFTEQESAFFMLICKDEHCGQVFKIIDINASAHSRRSCARHVLGRKP